VKIDEYNWDPIGNFSKNDLSILLNLIFKEFKNQELPAIYIIRDKLTSPFVIDTYLFNFKKNVNAIYLPEYLFFILNTEELKSIILHEIGHFKKYMLPLERFIFPLIFFIFLSPIYIYYFFHLYLFLPLYFISIFILFYNQKNIFYEKSTTQEYLSDFFSAERVGVLNCINGLNALIKYNEAIEYIRKQILLYIKKDKRLSVKLYSILLENIALTIPYRIYSKKKILKLINNYMSSDEIKKYYRDLSEHKIKKEDQSIDSMLVFNFMSDDIESADWSKFDNYIVNKKIEEEEYNDLIKYLKKNTDKVLFRETNEDRFSAIMNGSHPLVRNRILFLHKNKKYIQN
jgi:Zn-dependent protease with chaperone function